VLDWLKAFLESLGINRPTGSGWISVVVTFLLAAVATWLFIPSVRAFSLRAGWADEPNQRRINKVPVPNAGGLAVYAGALAALILATLLRPIVVAEVKAEVLAILLGGSLLMITGFIDDQFRLPPAFRLVVQVLAALLLVATGIRIEVGFGGDWAAILSGLFTVIWVVAITNAINLIDGVDGLAGGVSFIVGMSLLAVAAQFTERAASTILLAAVAGAALGFLRHNFHPSAIILGDSGAYFLGFVLAATSILGGVKVTTVAGLIPTGLFLLLPVADTAQVFFRRLARRKNPLSTPGKDHLHHHLLGRGFSQRRTALILWAITLATNLAAMVVQGIAVVVIVTTGVGIVVLLGLVVWRTWLTASLVRGAHDTDPAAPPPPQDAGAVPPDPPDDPPDAPELSDTPSTPLPDDVPSDEDPQQQAVGVDGTGSGSLETIRAPGPVAPGVAPRSRAGSRGMVLITAALVICLVGAMLAKRGTKAELSCAIPSAASAAAPTPPRAASGSRQR